MKKNLLTIICFLESMVSIHGQTLYGLTPYGGNEGWGAFIKFLPATNNLTVAKSFEGFPSGPLYTNLIQASDGKLYGMTNLGGDHKTGGWLGSGGGAIFSFDVSTGTYTKLKNFGGADGANPHGSLMQAGNGKLYGMTFQGGSNDVGVLFSFDPSTSTYAKLKDFDFTNGANPEGSLIQANNGKLYGMTREGGSNGYGVIFSFDPATSAYTKLKDFDLTNGGYPVGTLVQASNGKLYGVATGVIFSFDPATSIYTATNVTDPNGTLVQASDGKLYGTTAVAGTSNLGGIFSFDPLTSSITMLKDFDYTTGRNPNGSLVQAGNGKLYGMTKQGGTSNRGVIFSFDPSTSTYTKLKDFDGNSGSIPYGSLMRASNGKLYGMTTGGGSTGYGVIFSFDPSASTYTKLKDFEAVNGRDPQASLVQASNGKFYGMTPSGGNSDNGVIFSFDPATSIYTKLKDFDGADGAKPFGSLVQASNGKLYGMTAWGGNGGQSPFNGYGVIFSFDPATSTYTKLKSFDGVEAGNPYGNLMQASNGKLYGMTSHGVNSNGLSQGIIFSFDPSNSSFTKLKAFDITDGSEPYGSLVQVSNGKLYGMATHGGGSNGSGVIFSLDPSTSIYTKLVDFDGTNGGSPYGSFMKANNGKLYGMTAEGGSSGYGVIFSFDPSTATYAKLQNFNVTNGGCPYYNAGFIELAGVATGVNTITNSLQPVNVFPNPASGSTTISFFLDKPAHVSLTVFDACGKKIKTLADARFERGLNEFKWNPSQQSAGVYYVRFITGTYASTKKITVVN